MKKIILLFLSSLLVLSTQAQWTRTNVDTMNTGVEAMCEHNGSLYASIYGKGLIKYDNATNQWLEVADNLPPTSNSAHIVNLASVDNYLYAYVNDQIHASTTIYKSLDSGTTFVTDSVGHPRNGPFPATSAGFTAIVHDVFVLGDRLYNVMGGVGYTKKPTDAAWVALTDPLVKFCENFASYNNTWYAGNGGQFLTSTDAGATWVAPANVGLNIGIALMEVDPTTGRIYVANQANQFTVQKFFYSDNEGASWDSIAINQYLGGSWIGGIPQAFQGMIGIGNKITIMLTNNAVNSVIDVIKSTDGGLTFSPDTVGLPFDQFGAIAFVDFSYFKNQLWFAPNGADIYVQGSGSVAVKDVVKINTTVYPNPFTHSLQIKNDFSIDAIQVRNVVGNIIFTASPNQPYYTIDLSQVVSGIYFVTIISKEQNQILKVIKQ